MLNKERMLINACDVPNGKTNNREIFKAIN